MSFADTFNSREPQVNEEFKNKELIGDAVGSCQGLEKVTSKKDGKEWLILRSEAINCPEDPKGRETTVEPGDELVTIYDPESEQDAGKLQDDLFTAGIEVPKGVDSDSLIEAINGAVKDKLIYYRCWMGKKFRKKEEGGFEEIEGQKKQKIKIKSKNLITEENSVSQLPF